MMILIIGLPHQAQSSANGYAYVQAEAGRLLRSGAGPVDTWLTGAGECVVVVPATRLAWFELHLPAASHGRRLKPVLQSLLEERLLVDVETQHIVAAPDADHVARQGGSVWVCVCDKVWLREVTQPLSQAGLSIQRIVPEFTPTASSRLDVIGVPGQFQCILSDATGVRCLPPRLDTWTAFTRSPTRALTLHAEPAMAQWVEQHLKLTPQLTTWAQRWLECSQTDWDLAQEEWAQGSWIRLRRQVVTAWERFRHDRDWRPIRWGLTALLAVQLTGLNSAA